MDNHPDDMRSHELAPSSVDWRRRTIRIIIALVIVAVSVLIAVLLVVSKPRTAKRPPVKYVPVVQVVECRPTLHQVAVSAMGTVVPARSVILEARVAGQVTAVHPEFTDGGFVVKNDLLIQLDDADYRLVLAQRQSDLVNARYALELEQGRQEVAQREWELLNNGQTEDGDAALALRKPHLEKAQADLAAAEAAVRKARLDLARTRISAPFNAIIRSRSVDVGSQVSAGEPLAELVGTDAYWVRATLPLERLDWIRIPADAGQQGAKARIRYGTGHEVSGTVVRLLGDLTGEGRMARILVEVKDPLRRESGDENRPPLLIGEYVHVTIEGRQLKDVFAVPRDALRDNDTVWLLGDDNRLTIHKVRPIWRDADQILLDDGLKTGDRLITSSLPAPVSGMELRLETGDGQ